MDVCRAHGLWLDRSELLLITEHIRQEEGTFQWGDLFRQTIEPPHDRLRRLPCPVCEQIMILDEYHEVTIDRCRGHGLWLDNGELEAIINNLRLDPTYMHGIALRLHEADL